MLTLLRYLIPKPEPKPKPKPMPKPKPKPKPKPNQVHCGTIYIPTFYLSTGTLRGESFAESRAALRRDGPVTYASCSAYWVPFMVGVFRLVLVPGLRGSRTLNPNLDPEP
jgi:hypothetical protein